MYQLRKSPRICSSFVILVQICLHISNPKVVIIVMITFELGDFYELRDYSKVGTHQYIYLA